MQEKIGAPGAAQNETERFLRTETVHMIMTQMWFSVRKSRSLNNFPAVGFWTSVGISAPGAEIRRNESMGYKYHTII